jgi:Na+/melibiose symporter-like transporter
MATTPVTASVRRGYALGGVATGAFGTVPGLLLLPYLTDRLGVTAAIAGFIVFLPKAWDVILNPIAGRISDRSTHPGGRRRPFLIRAGLLLAFFFALMFFGPTSSTGMGAAWVVLMFLACATAYAFFQVPYVSMPAELTDDYDERTRIMTWRVAVLALAILVSGGLSPMVRDALGPAWGYRGVGLFVGALIAGGALGAWWGTRHATFTEVEAPTASLLEQLRIVARARDFRTLLTAFLLQALATGAMLAGVDYVARVLLGATGMSTILFFCFVAPALVVTPLWQRVGERLGKRTGFLIASLLLGGGAALALIGMRLSVTALAVAVAIVGVGYAGAQMFPLAMLPDAAAVDAARTGENRVGVYTGVWTAVETFGMALAPLAYAAALALGGYVSSTDGQAAQPESALRAIELGFTVLPAVLVALSLFFLLRYRLDASAVKEAMR